jgi:UDP-galactopyranose mutase
MTRFVGLGYKVSYAGCVGLRRKRQLPEAGTTAGVRWFHSNFAAQASVLAGIRTKFAILEVRQHLPAPDPVVWIYHPSLFPLVKGLPRSLLVYDVMDRFDSFQRSADAAGTDEQLLLQAADVIFTGGNALQASVEQKLAGAGRSAPVPVCFPSGVDLKHFTSAASADLSTPADIAQLPRPIFGYFGALDERLDYDLLVQLAATGGTVLLLGPQVTPPPADLPRNVVLAGARPYADLPAYLRAFDVCLLPFRNSELVAHISPTKTPEYLAGGKPVVSTAIPDVAETYGDVVRVTATSADFITACREAAEHPPSPATLQSAARRTRTWEQIASEMDAILQRHLP